jgi:hypothetical protein
VVQPYLFFVTECHGGKCHELPPACDDCGCGFRKFFTSGHRLFGRPSGMGVSGFQLPGIDDFCGGGHSEGDSGTPHTGNSSGFRLPGLDSLGSGGH